MKADLSVSYAFRITMNISKRKFTNSYRIPTKSELSEFLIIMLEKMYFDGPGVQLSLRNTNVDNSEDVKERKISIWKEQADGEIMGKREKGIMIANKFSAETWCGRMMGIGRAIQFCYEKEPSVP